MSKHRERALACQALYGLSFSPPANEAELADAFARSENARRNKAEMRQPAGFAWELTRGAWQRQMELNAAIEKFSHNWSIARMGRLEQVLLQLALYEILHLGTHPKIVISECMDLADEFGANDAKSFLNGILDAAARDMKNQERT